ncbi:hypothetical protein PENTCL1PPCAC_27101, partial [Pristionchus entomophagus]
FGFIEPKADSPLDIMRIAGPPKDLTFEIYRTPNEDSIWLTVPDEMKVPEKNHPYIYPHDASTWLTDAKMPRADENASTWITLEPKLNEFCHHLLIGL